MYPRIMLIYVSIKPDFLKMYQNNLVPGYWRLQTGSIYVIIIKLSSKAIFSHGFSFSVGGEIPRETSFPFSHGS